MYRFVIRPLLFLLDSETAHHLLLSLIRLPLVSTLLGWCYGLRNAALERKLFGLRFPNPVGLAAGFDKNAVAFRQLARLGFGFIEIGTVTPRPQSGNPRPRLFRLVRDEAIVNRMGFNNDGVDIIRQRLESRPRGLLIGGNIGKNKTTPNEQAAEDYLRCFEQLYDVVDYFVINVSSPNTPHLRELQEKAPLLELLQQVQQRNQQKPLPRPLLLKISPDLNEDQLDDIIEVVTRCGLAGVIATNTTVERRGLRTARERVDKLGAGGLSGRPLTDRSTAVIRYLHEKSGGAFPIIGVGGILTPQDAQEKLEAGASLVQLYTGFVFRGPSLIRGIKKHLLRRNPTVSNSGSAGR